MGIQTEGYIFMIITYTCITITLVYGYYKLLTKPKKH